MGRGSDQHQAGLGSSGDYMVVIVRRVKRTSNLEDMLAWQLKAEGIGYVREYRFARPRQWRFDFVLNWLALIAVECEGITRYGPAIGRHQSAKGIEADMEKYNSALVLGWKVLRVTEKHIKSGQALKWIKELMNK